MPYTADISRSNPVCLLLIVDQSQSMSQPFHGQPGKSKSQGVADAVNRLLQNIVLKCSKSDGVRDYFHVGVIGYGGKVSQQIAGSVVGQRLVPVSLIAKFPSRVEERERVVDDGHGGTVKRLFKFPVWFDPIAGGKTPMCEALHNAKNIVSEFIALHPDSYPPMVFHLTDGVPTDGDPYPLAKSLRGCSTTDGNVLLFNAHLSAQPGPVILFPAKESTCPNEYSKLLFRMSSQIPPKLRDFAVADGMPLEPGARGFVFNAGLVSTIQFLEVGTRITQNLEKDSRKDFVINVEPASSGEGNRSRGEPSVFYFHEVRNQKSGEEDFAQNLVETERIDDLDDERSPSHGSSDSINLRRAKKNPFPTWLYIFNFGAFLFFIVAAVAVRNTNSAAVYVCLSGAFTTILFTVITVVLPKRTIKRSDLRSE